MNYKQTGTKQITDDLKLKAFTWRPKSVHYDFDTRIASVEILMKENLHEHSRTFELALPEEKTELSTKEIMDFLLSLTPLKGSTEV